MKQKNILCAAGLAICLLSGCASQESKMEYIGATKAKNTALEASGIKKAHVIIEYGKPIETKGISKEEQKQLGAKWQSVVLQTYEKNKELL